MAKNWSNIRLGDICQTNKSTYSLSEKWDYVNYLDTGNLTQDKVSDYRHIVLGQDKLPSRARRKVEVDDILYSTVRPNQLHYGIDPVPLLTKLYEARKDELKAAGIEITLEELIVLYK